MAAGARVQGGPGPWIRVLSAAIVGAGGTLAGTALFNGLPSLLSWAMFLSWWLVIPIVTGMVASAGAVSGRMIWRCGAGFLAGIWLVTIANIFTSDSEILRSTAGRVVSVFVLAVFSLAALAGLNMVSAVVSALRPGPNSGHRA